MLQMISKDYTVSPTCQGVGGYSKKTKQTIRLTCFPKASSRVSEGIAGTNNRKVPIPHLLSLAYFIDRRGYDEYVVT